MKYLYFKTSQDAPAFSDFLKSVISARKEFEELRDAQCHELGAYGVDICPPDHINGWLFEIVEGMRANIPSGLKKHGRRECDYVHDGKAYKTYYPSLTRQGEKYRSKLKELEALLRAGCIEVLIPQHFGLPTKFRDHVLGGYGRVETYNTVFCNRGDIWYFRVPVSKGEKMTWDARLERIKKSEFCLALSSSGGGGQS